MGAGPVGLLHLMTIGALGEGRGLDVIVGAPLIFAPLGMAAFRIRHTNSCKKFRFVAGILWCFQP
jgi:hypothetical protein